MSRLIAPALALSMSLALPLAAQTAAPDAAAPGGGGAAPSTTPAAPADAPEIGGSYAFDPEHSQIVFTYDHLGFSTSRGVINGVTGTVTLDKADPAKSTVEASFPLSAIRTVAPSLDTHLFSADFLNGAAPETQVTFKSTSVKPEGDTEAEVTGDLTLNGVTRPVTLEVELNKAGAHPMTGKPAVGFDIEGRIKRSDFNLGGFAPAVSDEMEIEISVEASRG